MEDFTIAFSEQVSVLADGYQSARGLMFCLKETDPQTKQKNRELNLVDRPQGLFETEGFPRWSQESFEAYMSDERAAKSFDEEQQRVRDDHYLGVVAPTRAQPQKKKLYDPQSKTTYPEEYREPMVCRKMLLFGSCPDGSACRYTHAKAELEDAAKWYRRKLESSSTPKDNPSTARRVSVPAVANITSRDTSRFASAQEEEDSESTD